MRYAHALIEFKSVDADARIIEGIASTPSPDRTGDVMVPEGAQFSLPLPLLWQHRADQPIGKVLSATVTKAGIKIRAQIAKGVLPFIDEAWSLIKAGLVPGLSIGFKAIDFTPIEKSGGYRIVKWAWLELSAVTIPMNAEATITAVKSADASDLARLGPGSRAVASRPAVAGISTKDSRTMTYSERLSAAQGELTQKTADLEALMALETLTDEQTAERDSLTSEIDRLTATVKSLSVLQRVSETKAEPVTSRVAPLVPGQKSGPVLVDEPKLPPGVAFARMALCTLAAQNETLKGRPTDPIQISRKWYPNSERVQLAVKTAVAPATTTDSTWAGPLVYNETIADFVDYLRPRTIIGQFGVGNIPSLNRVPFNMRQIAETSAMSGYWVGQGKPKPLTKAGYVAQTLGFAKVAAITVDTEELLRFANHPTISAETAMRDGLTRALVAKIDTSLLDPALAAVSGVNPASLTNGLSLGSSAGNTADDVRTDVLALIAAVSAIGLGTTRNVDVRDIVLIMPPGVALALSLMYTTVGVRSFPDITVNGGTLAGFPVLVSNYAAQAGYGNLVVAVVASEINLADDGQVTVDMSREASLEMNDAPTQSGTTGVSLVSLWQDNLVAFRAERYINWGLRRSGVVAALQSVNWGGVGSPI